MSDTEPRAAGEIIEADKRLSQSSIWRLQRDFFDRQGVKAWSEKRVPSHVTSNAYIAEAYVRVALRFVHDCAAAPDGAPMALDRDEPIYIVECGSGHGYFGYLFLCKLLELQELIPFPMPPVCYVLTDFTESNLEFFEGHSHLRPFFDSGLLDVALFDAERDDSLELRVSGKTLSPGGVANPMIFIANYTFDSLSHDVFRIKNGALEEGLVSLRLTRPPDPAASNDILEHITLDYAYRPVDGDYYGAETDDAILRGYAERLGDTAFCYPLGAMRCLDHLDALTGGRVLLLTADKGYTSETALLALGDPYMAHHNGCISMMVNYHAMGERVRARGGFMLAQSQRNASLEIAALCLAGGQPMPETCLAFHDAMERMGPLDVYRMISTLDVSRANLDDLLTAMRASAWDPVTFIGLSGRLHQLAGEAYIVQLMELRQALRRVWELYFPLEDNKDVAFDLGYVHYAMRRYPESLEFYRQSLAHYGPHEVTLFNMGLCHYQQGELGEALRCFERSLEVNSSYGPSRDWRLRLQATMDEAREGEAETSTRGAGGEPALRPGPPPAGDRESIG